jgi:hypothetical protein
MVEDNFVEEAFGEISEDERSRILSNARVVTALKGKSTSIGSIKIGEEDVKFRLSVNKALRRKMGLYKAKAATVDPSMDELNSLMYDLLSSLCVEEPWNKWVTWSVYDDSADIGAMEVLLEMMKQVMAHLEDVKDFRRRRGRITPVEDLQVPVRQAQ